MATAQAATPWVRSAGTPINRSAIGGVLIATMVAGMMFGVMQMIAEALIGHGFWSPLRYIASVFTRGAVTDPSFSLGPVIVGLGGHMMNSMILGAIFAMVVWKWVRNPVVLAMLGMTWGAAVWAFMWLAVVPTVDPAMKLLDAPWFFGSHLLFGMVLGLGIAVAQRVTQRPALTTS
jgi:hypothetical protein